MERFSAQLVQDNLVVQGDLDVSTAAEFLAALDVARADCIVVDLAGLEFIDLTGVRTLATVHRARRARFLNPSHATQRMFDLAGVSDELLSR
jgi:anti-anti-sigma factor